MDKEIKGKEPSASVGQRIGYARVSTDDQNLNLQLDALARAGGAPTDIYQEKSAAEKRISQSLSKC